jgi:hypothetical protein
VGLEGEGGFALLGCVDGEVEQKLLVDVGGIEGDEVIREGGAIGNEG